MIKNRIAILCLCLAFGSLVILASTPKIYGEEIPDDVAVRIIVSEAGNQGLKGMICVGEVLRRRGSIKGFHGYQASSIKRQPKYILKMAAKAWEQSADTNYTQGADHFANIRRYGKPWWVKHCTKTYEYKDHVFYKEIHHR